MTPDHLFQIANPLAALGWLALAFSPWAPRVLSRFAGVAVPLVNNINNTRALALPQAWAENKHRAKTGPHTANPAGSHASPSAA